MRRSHKCWSLSAGNDTREKGVAALEGRLDQMRLSFLSVRWVEKCKGHAWHQQTQGRRSQRAKEEAGKGRDGKGIRALLMQRRMQRRGCTTGAPPWLGWASSAGQTVGLGSLNSSPLQSLSEFV